MRRSGSWWCAFRRTVRSQPPSSVWTCSSRPGAAAGDRRLPGSQNRRAVPQKTAISEIAMPVLFLCSQNRLRSPTAEMVFANWPSVECTSAGTNRGADTPLLRRILSNGQSLLCAIELDNRRVQTSSGRYFNRPSLLADNGQERSLSDHQFAASYTKCFTTFAPFTQAYSFPSFSSNIKIFVVRVVIWSAVSPRASLSTVRMFARSCLNLATRR